MGTLRSTTDHSGLVVNGVLLGDPVDIDGDPETFEWDDSAFPQGEIDADGNITLDEEEL
jgi:YD repeat-containing protein